ncbi:MAG: hypothetical protein ACK5CF_11770 [Opitutaceae bacterium]|jgi:hypothetical protein
MDDHHPKFTSGTFAVLQLSLEMNEDGQASQKTRPCGVFATVEEAFVSARLFAGREWARLQRAALENPSSPPLEIVDTEWGYDLRQGHAILARVWVHERQTVESA